MPMKKSEASAPTFEGALAELESIISAMEGGELPLEQSLSLYRRGTELLQYCQRTLEDAQQQVRILTENNTLQNFPGAEPNN